MAWVHAVIALALVEYFAFGFAVGRARVKYRLPAPATSGNADFERYYRVQANTLETLIVFIPSILIFAHYLDAWWAAGLGALFVIGRVVYFLGYTRAANRRHTGYALSMLPVMVLLAGALIGAVRAAL